MGAVYLGEHAMLGRPAAIKILLPALSQNREMVGRFFNEARATTAIRHPGIVEIYDFGFLPDGAAYIAMEMLEGESLASRLRAVGRVPVGAALDIGRQVAAALHAAHSRGITHRDLKPDNMFLIPDPEIGERVKLLDFGIAKLVNEDGGNRTRTGVVMGTPVYMSPEQCRGTSALDGRADLYSLGCVLFELLTGRPPFVAESAGDIIAHHLYFQPEPVRTYAPSVPEPLEQLIMALLAKAPSVRPASAADVSATLDSWRGMLAASPDSAIRTPLVRSLPVGPPSVTRVSAVNPIVAAAATTLSGSAGAIASPPGPARYAVPGAGQGVESNRRWVRPTAIGTVIVAAGVIAIALVMRRPEPSPPSMATAQTPTAPIAAVSPPAPPSAPPTVPGSPAAAASASPPPAPATSSNRSASRPPDPGVVEPPVAPVAAGAPKPATTSSKKGGDTVVPAPREEHKAAAPITGQGAQPPAAPVRTDTSVNNKFVDTNAMPQVDAVATPPETKPPEAKVVAPPVAPPKPRDQRASVFWLNAQRAAKTGDCGTALSLMNRIEQIDSAYFHAVIATDRSIIADCRANEAERKGAAAIEAKRQQEAAAADARRQQEAAAAEAKREQAAEAKQQQEVEHQQSAAELKRRIDAYVTQCRVLAARNECERARAIAARIAEQYPAVYRDQIANDAAIAKCLGTN